MSINFLLRPTRPDCSQITLWIATRRGISRTNIQSNMFWQSNKKENETSDGNLKASTKKISQESFRAFWVTTNSNAQFPLWLVFMNRSSRCRYMMKGKFGNTSTAGFDESACYNAIYIHRCCCQSWWEGETRSWACVRWLLCISSSVGWSVGVICLSTCAIHMMMLMKILHSVSIFNLFLCLQRKSFHLKLINLSRMMTSSGSHSLMTSLLLSFLQNSWCWWDSSFR